MRDVDILELTAPLRRRYRHLRRYVRRRLRKQVHRGAVRQWNKRYRHTYATRLDRVPARDEFPAVLNRRGLLGTGAEIGVKAGRFSEWMLKRWKGEKLISIDPWLEDAAEAYVDSANVAQAKHEEFYAETQARLRPFGARSEIWRATSVEAAERVPDRSLDFVYIDARHDYESVLEDLNAWYSKVKPGGIIAGHDYATGSFKQGEFGVKRAVDEFFAERGIAVQATDGKVPVEMFATWLVAVPAEVPARESVAS
jgi:hypothetical protein